MTKGGTVLSASMHINDSLFDSIVDKFTLMVQMTLKMMEKPGFNAMTATNG